MAPPSGRQSQNRGSLRRLASRKRPPLIGRPRCWCLRAGFVPGGRTDTLESRRELTFKNASDIVGDSKPSPSMSVKLPASACGTLTVAMAQAAAPIRRRTITGTFIAFSKGSWFQSCVAASPAQNIAATVRERDDPDAIQVCDDGQQITSGIPKFHPREKAFASRVSCWKEAEAARPHERRPAGACPIPRRSLPTEAAKSPLRPRGSRPPGC